MKHTILFLAANPRGAGAGGVSPEVRRVAIEQEASAIRTELQRSPDRDRFELETRWAVEPLDLLRELRELKPTLVHFSGHGGPEGLQFQDPRGAARAVSSTAIAKTIEAIGTSVKLVVLSACHSAATAREVLSLASSVDFVVGVSGALRDDTARSFAIGFYGALGNHESVAAAHRQGNAAIRLEILEEVDCPQLIVRDGVNANKIVLAAEQFIELPCPYPGMRPYTAADADRFFGREKEIAELIGRLRAKEREIYVIGPSGCGKSSLVDAGVLPRLAGAFVVRSMRPGEQPATRLRELLGGVEGEITQKAINRLAGHDPSASVLIVIDQLEELFTLADPGEQAQFLAARAQMRGLHRCVVVSTLRADFFGAFMESPLWGDRGKKLLRIEIGPMRKAALSEAIRRPAQQHRVRVESGLLEQLLEDAGAEPGVLPLLQETLVQLWDNRQGQLLTLADYKELGDGAHSGLAVALSRRADAILRQFTPAQEVIARRILLRLVSFSEGRSNTRHQQSRSKLLAANDDPADFNLVLQRLVDGRILAANGDDRGEGAHFDLAHEILITAWPMLAGWIQAHQADEQRRRQWEAAAAEWVRHGRGQRGLLDAQEFAEADAWRGSSSAREFGPSPDLLALIEASRITHHQRRRWRRVLAAIAVAIVAASAVVVTNLAVTARRRASEAEERRREVEHLLGKSQQEIGRQLLLSERSPAEAMPHLMDARKKGEEGEALQMLIWSAAHPWSATHPWSVPPLEHRREVVGIAFSPDGKRIATASWDHTAQIWDAATGRPRLPPFIHQKEVVGVAFNHDGTRLVTASRDNTARIWDTVTGQPFGPPLEHGAQVVSAVFSPNSTRVLTASWDHTACIWDVIHGARLVTLRHGDIVVSASFSRDGKRVLTASGDKIAKIWDSETGNPIATFLLDGPVVSAVFSPDGMRVAAASGRIAQIWDVATGNPSAAVFKHERNIVSVAFSPDGKRLVTASEDRRAIIWNAITGEPSVPALEHQRGLLSAAFNADGTRVVTTSEDKTARIWNAATGQPLSIALEHQEAVVGAVFSPDGTRLVTASWDKTARIWDGATGEAPRPPPLVHQQAVASAAFSPDSARVVTASDDHTARIWNVASGQPSGALLQHPAPVLSATFSPNGASIVTVCDDQAAYLWSAVSRAPVALPLRHAGRVRSAAFNPNSTLVVTAGDDRFARIWEAATGQARFALPHDGVVVRAVFSPDGARVLAVSLDKTARVWEVATGKQLYSIPHSGLLSSAAFSPDGALIITGIDAGTAKIWNATTGEPFSVEGSGGLTQLMISHGRDVVSAEFSPDRTRVVTASADFTALVSRVSTGEPVAELRHQQPVTGASFSLDGTRVLTASGNTVQIWDAETGMPLAAAMEHRGFVRSAVFSPDGRFVATASEDGTAYIWEVRLDKTPFTEWDALARQSPFVLSGKLHVRRQQLSYSSSDPEAH